MIRPASIVRFEQLYWASFVIGLVNTAITWTSRQQILGTNPVLANFSWFLPAVTVISAAVAVLLWYFIARRPSVVAKWFQVVFAAVGALGILSSLFMLATRTASAALPLVLGVIANICYVAAAVMLFKPDAKLWLGEGIDDDDDDLDAGRPRLEPLA